MGERNVERCDDADNTIDAESPDQDPRKQCYRAGQKRGSDHRAHERKRDKVAQPNRHNRAVCKRQNHPGTIVKTVFAE